MAKRLGRGYGSGKGGHTSSRGQKGQKSRGSVNILFEGLKVKKSTLKKFPFLRGKGKLKAGLKPVVIDAKRLSLFSSKEKVTVEGLVEKGFVKKSKAIKRGVKILNKKDLPKGVEINV